MLVYEYGGRGEPSNVDLIDKQIRLAHRYRNMLVEIERARRESVRALFAAYPDADLQLLQGQIESRAQMLEDVRGAIASNKKQTRTKKTPPELAAKRKEIGAELKQLRTELRERKRFVLENEKFKRDLDAIQEHSWQAIRDERAKCGVYWGTYLTVEQAADKARKERMDPRFKRFDGSGKIAVQLQGGLPVDGALLGRDTRLRIDPVPDDVWQHPTPNRHPGSRTFAHIRIGSEKRAPVWTTVPIIYHRPLPKDAIIKWAYLIKQKVGRKYRWRIQLIMETEPERNIGSGIAALDVGWRMIDGDLRVAYWVGDDGDAGEVRLPAIWLKRMAKVADLKSIRDQHFNTARGALVEWMLGDQASEWLREQTKHLSQWRSSERLVEVVTQWRDIRFDGDAEIFERMESWRKKEVHLHDWEANLRDKLLVQRREIYRVFADEMRARYGTIVLEKFDLRQAARRNGNIGEEAPDKARALRHLAALSELRNVLSQCGAEVVALAAEYTTVTCHKCGSVEQFDAAANLRHTCLACGTTWDQDYNAAKNLLAMATASSGAVTT